MDRRRPEVSVAQWGSVDDAPGAEPLPVERERAVRGLTDIARRSRGGMAVVVSHDADELQSVVAFDARLGIRNTLPQDTVLQHPPAARRQLDGPQRQRTPCRAVVLASRRQRYILTRLAYEFAAVTA